ncbi:MAG: hypothetical protein ABI459_01725, partial [Deltaproteobacteria bacterium]
MNDSILSAFIAGPVRETAQRAAAQPDTVTGDIIPEDFALLLDDPDADLAGSLVTIMAQLAQPQPSLPLVLPIVPARDAPTEVEVQTDSATSLEPTDIIATGPVVAERAARLGYFRGCDASHIRMTPTDVSAPVQAILAVSVAIDSRSAQVSQVTPEDRPTAKPVTNPQLATQTAPSAGGLSAPKTDATPVIDSTAPKAAPAEAIKSAPLADVVSPVAKTQVAQATTVVAQATAPQATAPQVAQDNAPDDDPPVAEPTDTPDDKVARPLAQ